MISINQNYLYPLIRYARRRSSTFFERGHKENRIPLTLDQMVEILIETVKKKTIWQKNDYCFIKTKVRSNEAFMLFPQARLALVFSKLAQQHSNKTYLEYAEGFAKYLIAFQDNNGLFRFHKPVWSPKDEGIMTFLAIISLVTVYQHTGNPLFLSAAVKAGENARALLYDRNSGYIHTLGHTYWCINVSAAASHAYDLLYLSTKKEEYLDWARDGVEFVQNSINKDNFFPYSAIQNSIYLVSYHAIDMYYLYQYEQNHPNKETKKILDRALAGLLTKVRSDGSIKEEELPYYAYVNSVAVSFLMVKLYKITDIEHKVINYLNKFFTTEKMYIFSQNHKLYDGHYKDFYENIVSEVLLWLIEAKEE